DAQHADHPLEEQDLAGGALVEVRIIAEITPTRTHIPKLSFSVSLSLDLSLSLSLSLINIWSIPAALFHHPMVRQSAYRRGLRLQWYGGDELLEEVADSARGINPDEELQSEKQENR